MLVFLQEAYITLPTKGIQPIDYKHLY